MRQASGRRAQRTGGAIVALMALTAATARASSDGLEYRVKAEFVERFTRFIDWPPTAFASAEAPFVLCVVGDTPLQPYLEQLAHARRIKGRAVELRRLHADANLSSCHLAFIAGDARPQLPRIIGAIAGRPILTVGDSEGFGRAGVLINLVVGDDGRVGFDISSAVARRSSLTLNAQLLRLSRRAPEDN